LKSLSTAGRVCSPLTDDHGVGVEAGFLGQGRGVDPPHDDLGSPVPEHFAHSVGLAGNRGGDGQEYQVIIPIEIQGTREFVLNLDVPFVLRDQGCQRRQGEVRKAKKLEHRVPFLVFRVRDDESYLVFFHRSVLCLAVMMKRNSCRIMESKPSF